MKLRNKLILSCAALAAVATTAVSTTYAWYTSNEKVTAQNIVGASADSGSDLLMIADGQTATTTGSGDSAVTTVSEITTLTNLDWKTSLSNVVETLDQLTPLAYTPYTTGTGDSATTIYNLQPISINANNSAVAPSATEASGYLKFVLYLKNVGQTAKDVVMKVDAFTNTTSPLPTKQILDATNNMSLINSTWTSGSHTTYKVDVRRTLCADIEIQKVTAGALGSAIEDETVYELEPAAGTITDDFNGGNAHQYYNAVMTETPISAADISAGATATAAFTAIDATNGNDVKVTVPAGYNSDDYLKLTFKVFINGWDAACFDAVQGQGFTLGLSFSIKK